MWRFDQQIQAGTLVDSDMVTVAVSQFPEDFQCISIHLDQEEYVNITAGDFLGVYLFSGAVLPVINNYLQPGPPPTLVFTQSFPFPVEEVDRRSPQTVDLSSNAIHVTASIGEKLRS